MNTNTLKKFAQEARKKLLSQIGSKLTYVLNADSAELRSKATQIQSLKDAILASSEAALIDQVAYTWFNRFMALRFMDVNDYQPLGIRVVSPKVGFTLPEILQEAKQGILPVEFTEAGKNLIIAQHLQDLLDGKIPSNNPQNDAYKELLIAACNHLHRVFPFLFERLEDYSELLLPDDLTSPMSILQDIRQGMSEEYCKEVELIGWLYQFYISEKKDEVFATKKAVKKEDIPAATQLFTPRWIVEYMVQNTVGKLWLQNKPNSKLRQHMPYFIESPSVQAEEYLKINSVEELTLLDQACGSGHILVYGFELLYKIYEEEGYNAAEIPKLIIEKNLFGFEIDTRAAQLAGFALMMKARSYHRRFFRNDVKPNILCYKDFALSDEARNEALERIAYKLTDSLTYDLNQLKQATNYGSLISPHTSTSELKQVLEKINANENASDAFLRYQLEQLKPAIEQLIYLRYKYHCVVDNPPYMGGGNMNAELSAYVKTNYPDSKADLMACFMEAGLKALQPMGFLGMINQHSWMFLSSYEVLRKKLIENTFFDTNLHLGPRTFPEIGGEVVQNASFTIWNTVLEAKGNYFRLVDLTDTEQKRLKVLESLTIENHELHFITSQKDFEKIPGSPIGYWLSDEAIKTFLLGKPLCKYSQPRQGLATMINERFVKNWSEVKLGNFNNPFEEEKKITTKWHEYNKGGDYRKWYGNREKVVNWKDNGFEIKKLAKDRYNSISKRVVNEGSYFKKSITWSKISSSLPSFRLQPEGAIFDVAGMSIFFENLEDEILILAFLNSKIAKLILEVLSPTLNFEGGHIGNLPIISKIDMEIFEGISNIVKNLLDLSKHEWDSNESSWDFQQNELIRLKGQDLEESFDLYKAYWQKKFFEIHKNEEELNHQFIVIYGLQDELTQDVHLGDIAILKEQLLSRKQKTKKGEETLAKWTPKWTQLDKQFRIENEYLNIELPFDNNEVFAQFISYAVGCMFGRYSLDKEGLILANQGETLEDYLQKIGNLAPLSDHFLPDEDNIIPVLDDEWFEDDIVGRFYAFLKASFGSQNFEKNRAFVEECLGKDIRKYFVKDFYNDHIKRYKKRPIYWMFSSPKGSFNVLVYMHRYTPDTLNRILNGYLVEYHAKLNNQIEQLDHLIVTGSSVEQTRAAKDKDKVKLVLIELQEYERSILYPLATERISIDLDDGVLVNYNKFGKAIKEVSGLNDSKTKEKVKEFDWIDNTQIR
ncbi:hypothetical protein MCERE19_00682 [Spirosomataceae bacterium]